MCVFIPIQHRYRVFTSEYSELPMLRRKPACGRTGEILTQRCGRGREEDVVMVHCLFRNKAQRLRQLDLRPVPPHGPACDVRILTSVDWKDVLDTA